MTNIKEKLIELICSTEYGNSSLIGNNFQKGFIEKIADHIIASGYIEELQNEAYDLGVDSALHNHFGLSWEDAAGLRKEIKSLQEATRWIPVTERLPEDDLPKDTKRRKIRCLVYSDKGTVKPCVRQRYQTKRSGEWVLSDWEWNKDIFAKPTHWMYMPEPPKGE